MAGRSHFHTQKGSIVRKRFMFSALLALALVVGSVAPAQAAVMSVSTADTPPGPALTPNGPSGTNPRQFMINMLGKMLGPVTPDSWKREQIAYTQRYNHDWETLERQFSQDPANPDYAGSPDSYQDYTLKNLELKKNGGTGSKPMTVPATKLSRASAIVGGAFNGLAYIAAAQTGFQVGKTFSRAIGLNPEGGLCDPGFNDAGVIALVTQTDCSSLHALSPEYQKALADHPSVTGGKICIPDGAWCVELLGMVPAQMQPNGPTGFGYCFNYTGSDSAEGYQFQALYVAPTESRWQGMSQGSVSAFTGSGFQPWAQYGCAAAGFPSGTQDSQGYKSGGVAMMGAPWNSFTGSKNDPLQYRLTNGYTVSPVGSAVDGSNAQSTVECSITGDNGQTYTQSSAPYKDSSGVAPAPSCPSLPDGVSAVHIAASSVGPSGSKPMGSADTTPEYQDWFKSYPECRDGQCKLDLLQGSGAAAVKSCFDMDTACDGWFADPDKASKYQCRYGIHDVAQDQCALYSGVFNTSRLSAGAPYSDPMTGVWSGGQSSPSPDKQALSQQVQNPDIMRTCNGMESKSFDPVAWVMRPIQCAFEWAFVPREAVVQVSLGDVSNGFDATVIGKLVLAVKGWNIAPNVTGCRSDMPFPVPMIHQTISVPIIQACPGTPMGDFAAWARLLVSAGLSITAALACKRIVSGWIS